MAFFQNSVLNKYLKLQEKEILQKAYKKYAKYFHNLTIQENIKNSKEEEYQGIFLTELFVTILGYELSPKPNFNLVAEYKNQTNSRKADGAILKDGIALGVIELKGTKTKDLESIRRQAFDYKANQKGCVYVITSNFEKLRFYINDATDYEEFNLFTLTENEFQLLYLCLSKESIFSNTPLKIKEESITVEEKITKSFYADYSLFKRELYRDLVKRNAKKLKTLNQSELVSETAQEQRDLEQLEKNVKRTLFKKSQKLIDRFLFIFFAEDRGLLPPNSTVKILDKWDSDIEFGDDRPLYNLFKQYFNFLDSGRKQVGKRAEIYAYNGGLFKPDAILDAIEIDDKLLSKHTRKLANYDFESQVDVNILGHIFENSLNEIESVNAEIEGGDFDKQKSKRKKDGVFYTPKYITKYIVENTVGKLCEEKKQALDFKEEEYFKSRKSRPKKKLLELVQLLDTYRDWLLQLTICDPACGSGAFLNQALDFLIKEHRYIDELKANVLGGGLVFADIETTILENNIFGVDLNEESVEIAKLSLWLRTAQPRRKLNDLSSNIKCGNSLIDSKAVAGDKAFNWQEQFPQVFKKQDKKAYHITTAIHDSRTSARMVKYKVREKREMGTNPYPNVVYFTEEDDLLITQTIATIVKEEQLNMLAYNICADHIHLLLVCDIDEVPSIMQKIKGKTSFVFTRDVTRGLNPLQNDNKGDYKGLKSLVEKKKENKKPLWQQKYSAPKEITSQEQLNNTIDYIQNNRSKHKLPEHSNEINTIINTMCSDANTAFNDQYNGGFDVVIGNPPYVRQELFKEIKPYLEKNYKCYNSVADLYTYFIEKGINLINEEGLFSFILPNKFLKATYGKQIRKVIKEDANLELLFDFDDYPVFADATTYPIIYVLNKKQNYKNDYFIYSEINKRENTLDPINSLELKKHKVQYESLTKDMWNFIDINSFKLLNKLKNNSITLGEETNKKIFRGLTTGRNEAFIIDDVTKNKLIELNSKNAERIKILATGKEVKRNTFNFQNKYLLFTGYDDDIPNQYPDIQNELDKYKDALIKRYDQGENYWNLRACAYYEEMQMPKIIYPRINNRGNFYLDKTGEVFLLDNNFFISTDSKSLLALLNSKLVYFYLKSICTTLQGGFYDFRRDKITTIPISNNFKSIDVLLSKLSDNLIEFTNENNLLVNKFQRTIQRKFELEKLPKKLQEWYKLTYSEFVKELAKKKIKLSLSQEAEWEDYFISEQQKAVALKTQIDQTDKEIDQMVYELYGLTDDEIMIVEQS